MTSFHSKFGFYEVRRGFHAKFGLYGNEKGVFMQNLGFMEAGRDL